MGLSKTRVAASGILIAAASIGVLQAVQTWPPPVRKTPTKAPVLTAAEELKTFVLPPGYHAQLVAQEPLVMDPIAIDFDADGRLWVLEMPGFMSEPNAMNSREPVNDVVVLEDKDGDGVMDTRTVFADKLVLPRSLKVTGHGVLVGEPPNLWLMKDTDGALKADSKVLVSNTYGRGEASIEHNANSLLWGMDNTIHTSEHDWNVRLVGDNFETVPTLSRGQWGATQDDAGRIYRNVNDAPLFVDLIAARYYTRNPDLARTRGLYDPLISREASIVWPVRATRGVNRGYRDQFFRPDDSSVTIQGVGTPVIYRGDRLPKELRGDAFITDSTTNLVHRYKIVDDGTGRLSAVDGYKKGEILASWDERFRPVNLLGAPDGTLYVVDMYRGVVQEAVYWTDYLRDYIKAGDLEQPIKHGRIWRIVHDTTKRDRTPALSKATPAELVQTLNHPNGWWRDTAQRLLVERHATAVAPQLRALAVKAPDWRTKLQALWTLDGLDSVEAADVQQALGDGSPEVRAAAVRLSERWLREGQTEITAAVLKLAADPSWTVRRQVGASIGEMPAPARLEPAVALLARYGTDAVLVDATISGLRGIEAEALDRVVQARPSAEAADAVAMLAAAAAKSADVPAVERVVARAAETAAPAWQRDALLQGLDTGLPAAGGGRGGRGGRGAAAPVRLVTLPAEPAALTALALTDGETAVVAKRIVAKLEWPGKPAPVVTAAVPFTPEQQRRYDAGSDIYRSICVGCHQPDGRGKDKIAPSLVDSKYVLAPDGGAAMRVLLGGKEGTIGLMPPLGSALNDEQIASVLTYIRREWGHTGSAVAPDDVQEIRGLTKARTRPWTDAELPVGGRGGRAGPAPPAAAATGYRAERIGEVVRLEDTEAATVVSILPSAGNKAFEMKVKGQNVLYFPFASVQDFQGRDGGGFNGIPFLGPWANRLDEQAFWANGQRYAFDMQLGNVRGAIPIHGLVTTSNQWRVIEVKSDARAAWATSRLEFYRNPAWIKQFPFAHTIDMTYRLEAGVLQVITRITNLSTDPMPVAIGYHPYFQLTDSNREDWTISVAAKSQWLLAANKIPTGETEPIEKLFPDPHAVPLKDFDLDHVFGDLVRDERGRSLMTLRGKAQRLDVLLGPNYRSVVIYAPKPVPPGAPANGRGQGGAAESRNFICFEPMAGITDAMNLAQKGLYKELQSIAPGGTWEESFWLRPSGF